MKTMYSILTMLLLITGCDKEDVKQQENSIYGDWQLIKRTANRINEPTNSWENIDNGANIVFKENFNFKSNEITACENVINKGTFITQEISDNNIIKNTVKIIIDNCSNKPSGAFIRLFYYAFDGNNLILTPKEPACDEGCAFLYKKME